VNKDYRKTHVINRQTKTRRTTKLWAWLVNPWRHRSSAGRVFMTTSSAAAKPAAASLGAGEVPSDGRNVQSSTIYGSPRNIS